MPNPRVQRTRVARCARPGSPLTRYPLGGTYAPVRLQLLFAALLPFVSLLSCTAHRDVAVHFGTVDPKAVWVDPKELARVSQGLTLDEIFRILGPAQTVSTSCPGDCWQWYFADGQMLEIPIDSNPQARPRAFTLFLVDGAA